MSTRQYSRDEETAREKEAFVERNKKNQRKEGDISLQEVSSKRGETRILEKIKKIYLYIYMQRY